MYKRSKEEKVPAVGRPIYLPGMQGGRTQSQQRLPNSSAYHAGQTKGRQEGHGYYAQPTREERQNTVVAKDLHPSRHQRSSAKGAHGAPYVHDKSSQQNFPHERQPQMLSAAGQAPKRNAGRDYRPDARVNGLDRPPQRSTENAGRALPSLPRDDRPGYLSLQDNASGYRYPANPVMPSGYGPYSPNTQSSHSPTEDFPSRPYHRRHTSKDSSGSDTPRWLPPGAKQLPGDLREAGSGKAGLRHVPKDERPNDDALKTIVRRRNANRLDEVSTHNPYPAEPLPDYDPRKSWDGSKEPRLTPQPVQARSHINNTNRQNDNRESQYSSSGLKDYLFGMEDGAQAHIPYNQEPYNGLWRDAPNPDRESFVPRRGQYPADWRKGYSTEKPRHESSASYNQVSSKVRQEDIKMGLYTPYNNFDRKY